MAFLFAFAGIAIAAIAGWSVVASMQVIARSRTAPEELLREVERLSDAVAELRDELEAVESKEERDVLALEERIDFAERLLTKHTDN
jgi:biopolymer transport protein ExbB/TolQ